MIYQIKVQGQVDSSWSDWFDGLKITIGIDEKAQPVTTLTGEVIDQSVLRGIINHLWDLNLALISVNLILSSETG